MNSSDGSWLWSAVLLLAAAACGGDPPKTTRIVGPTASPVASASEAPVSVDHVALARAFVEHLAKSELEPALAALSPELQKKVDAPTLASVWALKKAGGGDFVKIDSAALKPAEGGEAVTLHVALSNGTIDVGLQFKFGKPEITGLQIQDAKTNFTSASYVDPSKFDATDVSIGEGDLALPGTLLTPKGAGPFPIVLLVNGSGGGDRDESIGPSKPFRDIAEGLASKGIAVLRWDKRTHDPKHVLALKIDLLDLTVKEEYLDDFASALKVASSAKGVDPKRVFVLGHSEGGWLAPWLVKLHPDIKGAIVLAGNARHFSDIFVSQAEYLLTADDGKLSDDDKAKVEAVKKQVAIAKDPKTPREEPMKSFPFGIGPAKYWRSLDGYDAVATAKGLSQPFLVLQGGRDYQVTEKDDYALWKSGLGSKKGAEFQLFPKLNHAFCAGEGMATPNEYLTLSGHVDEPVIKAIAAFVDKPASSASPFGKR
ncbi:MAG: alpha/beta hydrolase [Polyangiaceae bacterium]